MPKEKKSSNEEKIEREYVIPLRRQCTKTQKYRRAPKAIKTIKEFLVRHMKIYDRDLNKIKIDGFLNEEIWFRGIKKPPARIKVKAIKEINNKGEEIVRVELAELPQELKFKKARQDKQSKSADEISKQKQVEKAEETKSEEVKEEKKEDSKIKEEKPVKVKKETKEKVVKENKPKKEEKKWKVKLSNSEEEDIL